MEPPIGADALERRGWRMEFVRTQGQDNDSWSVTTAFTRWLGEH